jgi:putative ABC transport system permease protein
MREMNIVRTIWLRIRSLWQRREVKREIDEELRFHLEQRTAENVAAGMSPEDAAREARKRFGNLQSVREECREAWRANWGEGLLRDFRLGLRRLCGKPGFTAVVVLTLGIGIAVNAVFTTIANDLFFRPLPAAAPDELVVVATRGPGIPYQLPYSYPDAVDFRRFVEGGGEAAPDMARVFSGLMAYKEQVVHLSQTGKSTERAWVHATTDNYFAVLGVQPHLGRFFRPEEVSTPGSEAVLVLTYDAWRTCFGADPGIIGQSLKINGTPFTVIGVAPQGFFGASWGTELSGFVPATMLTRLLPGGEYYVLQRGNSSFFLMGRLRAGASLAQAQAAMDVALARVMKDNPGKYFPDSRAVVMRESHSRPSPYIAQHTPKILAALTGLGLLVLVVALANAANLLYARNASREREFAICSAVGAARFHLIRRVLAESLLVAVAAGIVGGLASLWLTPALVSLLPVSAASAPAAEAGLDWRPFVVTGLVSLIAGFLAGILPAFKISGGAPLEFLREATRTSASRRHPLRGLLVAGQVAVSTVVLVCAAFALRSVVLLSRADLGFRTSDLHLVSFDLGAQRYSPQQGQQFQSALLEQVRALPGVEQASLTTGAPLDTGINLLGGIRAAEDSSDSKGISVPTIRVEHAYLSTLGMAVVAGRDFTPRDDAKAPRVAIVNGALAKALWPGREPTGQRIAIQGEVAEVVGVVAPSRYYGIQETSRPLLVVPLAQNYRGEVTLVVRTPVAAAPLAQAIVDLARKQDADLPLFNPRTMKQQIERSPSGVMPFRMGAILASFQGSVVLALAGAGIFSLIAFGVARRTREIGIRMALGATRWDVIRAVTRESLVLTGAGIAAGLAVAFGLIRLLSGMLYGTGPADVLIYVLTAVVIALVGVAACWLPARRATRVNPTEALRCE